MVDDVLELEDGEVVQMPNGSEIILSEYNDQFWRENRHSHLAKCMEMLPIKFAELLAKREKKDVTELTVSGLASMMQEMPQYQKEIKDLQIHMELINLCGEFYTDRIDQICDAEQDLATHVAKEPLKLIIPWLLDSSTPRFDKIRLIVLYILNRKGVKEVDLEKLITHAGLAQNDSKIIRSMVHFNIPVIKDEIPETKRMKRKKYDVKYQDSRYVPLIKDIMQVRNLRNLNRRS